MSLKSRLAPIAEELFGIDVRSLALFRMGAALAILVDLLIRATDLTAHYTDTGALPRAALRELQPGVAWFVAHVLSGSPVWQGLLFLLAAGFAVLLLIGYRTRLATCASWLLLASVQQRAPFVMNGGDNVLRLMLFWSLFVPLGACWSLDRARQAPTVRHPQRLLSAGTVALLSQVVFVYVFAGLLKSSDAAWQHGTALFHALHVDKMVTRFGQVLGSLPPDVLTLATRAVHWVELVGPAALFVPVATGPLRTAAVVVFALLQLSFGLSLELGLFPWICTVALAPFLPTWFWEQLNSRLRTRAYAQPKAVDSGEVPKHRISSRASWSARRLGPVRPSWIGGTCVALLLGYTALWNLGTLEGSDVRLPKQARWLGRMLWINQHWGMFTEMLEKDDTWLVIPGRLADGTEVDLATDGGAVTWRKPPLVSARIKNARWAAYEKHLWLKRATRLPHDFARHLCRRWNARHPRPRHLEQLEIVALVDKSPARPGAVELERVPIVTHSCGGAGDARQIASRRIEASTP